MINDTLRNNYNSDNNNNDNNSSNDDDNNNNNEYIRRPLNRIRCTVYRIEVRLKKKVRNESN